MALPLLMLHVLVIQSELYPIIHVPVSLAWPYTIYKIFQHTKTLQEINVTVSSYYTVTCDLHSITDMESTILFTFVINM